GARVPAMVNWKWRRRLDKTVIRVYDYIVEKYKSHGLGEEWSGIDMFIGSLFHEAKHLDQITRVDALVPNNGPWKNGWSFNTREEDGTNHWTLGTDKQPGVAGLDDDSD